MREFIAVLKALFVATREMEELAEEYSQAELIVCDRGTVDAAVYWPGGVEDFFKTIEKRKVLL